VHQLPRRAQSDPRLLRMPLLNRRREISWARA
jgi:hypothetical protein